jgi:hypothetical protein
VRADPPRRLRSVEPCGIRTVEGEVRVSDFAAAAVAQIWPGTYVDIHSVIADVSMAWPRQVQQLSSSCILRLA